jgi:energy-converting hydrogenase Eha subunit C
VHPLLDCLTSIFLRLVVLSFRIWAIEDPRSKASAGVGAFNLMRRATFERTPGLAWLKMEVADDLSLGQMLKAAGARQSVVNGRAMTDLQFHSSIGDSLRSAERATYTAIGNFSLLRLLALAVLALMLELSPIMVLAMARTPLSQALGLGLLASALVTMVVSNRWLDRSSWNLVFWPIAEFLVCYSQLRAGALGALRGGIIWRGTFYPNAVLKAGRRFGQAWAHPA